MDYNGVSKPGMGDPYWYEWSVGQKYLLEMLNTDSNIKNVSLQKDVSLGLDDVVVTYKDDTVLCVQVKHTRADNIMTFSDLVHKNAKENSLLSQIATSWYEEKGNYTSVIPQIFTNRKNSEKDSKPRAKGGNNQFLRPALSTFLSCLQEQLKTCEKLSDIVFEDYEEAWKEWIEQLSNIKEDDDKLLFLKLLKIETSRADLKEIQNELVNMLMELFSINDVQADVLLGNLDHALRNWTTSIRNKEDITEEDVYQALSIDENRLVYNHDFTPTEPFFESRLDLVNEIENELLRGKEPIVFLRGIPGIGKTNIVSKLSNKRNSMIRIRYYAYEPIQPGKEYLPTDVSERVGKNVFWDELLAQLRKCIKGKLAEYHMPLKNSFLTTEEKKTTFLKIASEYAQKENAIFVVSIDGLDHAARAGMQTETFLSTLPNPEYIPSNLKFIISGQPEEAYENYPRWIRTENEYVKKFEVPGIQRGDIFKLVQQKIPLERSSEYEAITDVVVKFSEGNTLAAIFAVYEACNNKNMDEFVKSLTTRRLSGNIEEYYNNIWQSAIAKISAQFSFIEYKLAGVFALLNENINSIMLFEIFKEINISNSDWTNILKSMRPLVVEENGKYRILHNDIRVFLSKVIKCDNDHVIEIADDLATYYLNNKYHNRFYFDICKLLRMSGRSHEIAEVFTPEFAIEAYVYGMELGELDNIARDVLEELMLQEPLEFEKIQLLSCTLMTIEQIRNTQYEIEECNFREKNNDFLVVPYECYVEENSHWNSDVIISVLDDVIRLLKSGLKKRAKDMFSRWFDGMALNDIWVVIREKGVIDNRFEKNKNLSQDGKNIAVQFGTIFSEFRLKNMFETTVNPYYDAVEMMFMRIAYDAYINRTIDLYTGDLLEEVIQGQSYLSPNTLIDLIIKMLTARRYIDIGIIQKHFNEKLNNSQLGLLINLFMKIISSKIGKDEMQDRNNWISTLNNLEIKDYGFEYEVTYYCILAVTLGYLEIDKDSSIVAKKVLVKYMEKHPHQCRGYYGVLFNLLCVIGFMRYQIVLNLKITNNSKELEHLLNTLFIRRWGPSDEDYNCRKFYSIILSTIILFSKTENQTLKEVVNKICSKCFSTNPVNQILDAGWYYYSDTPERLAEWYEFWLGEDGNAWNESIGEKNRIAKDIITEIYKYNLEKYFNIEDLLQKLKWSVVGYASHKEYILAKILPWYQQLVKFDSKNIDVYTNEIKKLSNKVNDVGDNRMSYQVDCSIYADLFRGGIESIKKLSSNALYAAEMIKEPDNIVNGLIGYLEDFCGTNEELLMIWSFGIGILDWRNDGNSSTIAELKRAIILTAEKNKNSIDEEQLSSLGKMEISCYSDPVRYHIPDRWCDNSKYSTSQTESVEKINEAISIGKISSSIIHNLENIKSDCSNETFSEYLFKVMDISVKEDSSWNHNLIMEYIIQNLQSEKREAVIKSRFLNGIKGEIRYFYLNEDLQSVCQWVAGSYGENFCKKGLDNLLSMQQEWISSAKNLKQIEKLDDVDEEIDYIIKFINPESINDMNDFFVKYLVVNVLGKDADRAEIALKGIYNLIQIDSTIVNKVFTFWPNFHYRAKEWFLMIVDRCMERNVCKEKDIENILLSVINSPDLNIALYSRLLLGRLNNQCLETVKEYPPNEQDFFVTVPQEGRQKLIKYTNNERTVAGDKYAMEAIEWLRRMSFYSTDGIEERTATYEKHMEFQESKLFDNKNDSTQLLVAVTKIQKALLDVLYADWVYGRWELDETVLAQVVLSSTEPFILLDGAYQWPYNDGKALGCEVSKFMSLSDMDKRKQVMDILQCGLSDQEILLGGVIVDFDNKNELFCYMSSYFSSEKETHVDATNLGYLNGRTLLVNEEDFFEANNRNLILLNGGVGSFCNDQLLCSISKFALDKFGWKLEVKDDLTVINETGKVVIRFEKYNIFRSDIANRTHCNQPMLQRWIMEKDAYNVMISVIPLTFSVKNKIDIRLNQAK